MQTKISVIWIKYLTGFVSSSTYNNYILTRILSKLKFIDMGAISKVLRKTISVKK